MSIIEIAIACGFVSTPHFSKCYRNSFSMPPRDERNNMHGTLPVVANGESSFGAASLDHH